jgi:hypothetical protein
MNSTCVTLIYNPEKSTHIEMQDARCKSIQIYNISFNLSHDYNEAVERSLMDGKDDCTSPSIMTAVFPSSPLMYVYQPKTLVTKTRLPYNYH